MKLQRWVTPLLVTIGCLTLTVGCMTPEEQAALQAAFDIPSPIASPNPIPVPDPEETQACFNERYEQPAAQISRTIDLLFVMDTSGSMKDNRAKVADGISAFVSELPANVDYNVAVMLSTGSKSKWSGRLFSYGGRTVFSSKTMAVGDISARLKDMVLHTPQDPSGEESEEGSYSLIKGLTTNLDLNRSLGFFARMLP